MFALHDRGALVGFLLSARDANPHFDHSALIIHRKGNDCQTRFLFLCGELGQFFFGEEEAAVALRLVISRSISRLIRGYLGVEKKRLAAADGNVRALEFAAVVAERFHLGAEKLDPRLELLKDLIVEMRLFVLDQIGHIVC